MSSAVSFQRDASGQNTFAPNIDGTVFRYSVTLAAATETNFSLPRGTKDWLVSFLATPGAEVWYAFSPSYDTPVVAEVPAGATIVATTSELNTGTRTMAPETYISMITAVADVSVSIVLWNVPS